MAAERVAAADALEGKEASFGRAMRFHRFCTVSRAGGCEAAVYAKKRRDGHLVGADEKQDEAGENQSTTRVWVSMCCPYDG